MGKDKSAGLRTAGAPDPQGQEQRQLPSGGMRLECREHSVSTGQPWNFPSPLPVVSTCALDLRSRVFIWKTENHHLLGILPSLGHCSPIHGSQMGHYLKAQATRFQAGSLRFKSSEGTGQFSGLFFSETSGGILGDLRPSGLSDLLKVHLRE